MEHMWTIGRLIRKSTWPVTTLRYIVWEAGGVFARRR